MGMQHERTRNVVAALGLAAAVALPVAAVAAAEQSPRQHTVVMDNMNFGSMPAGAKVGDTIIWVNRDTVPHTATTRGKGFDVRLQAGQRAKMTLKKAGNFAVYCIYHPAMRTSLKVS
jgi:plastocyanin